MKTQITQKLIFRLVWFRKNSLGISSLVAKIMYQFEKLPRYA